ncbi:ABC transporter B family member 4-like protein [Tanacetum coccineum]
MLKGRVKGKARERIKVISLSLKTLNLLLKEHLAKGDTCHHYKEVGHCKRNCPAYLAKLIKKKKVMEFEITSTRIHVVKNVYASGISLSCSYTDRTEYMLMFVDTVGATVNEVCMPLITLLFGDLINSFGDNENNNDVVKAVSKVSLKFVYLTAGAGVAAFLHRNTGEVADMISGDTVPIQDVMGEKVGTLEHRHGDADTLFCLLLKKAPKVHRRGYVQAFKTKANVQIGTFSDTAAIQVGEALAIGQTNIMPGGVAAAAQSAAIDMLISHEKMIEPG